MIIRLQRPAARLDGPWRLTAPGDGPVDFARPAPELRRMMQASRGYFNAERTAGGWEIKGPANADLVRLRPPL